jgi:hypothetical protein
MLGSVVLQLPNLDWNLVFWAVAVLTSSMVTYLIARLRYDSINRQHELCYKVDCKKCTNEERRLEIEEAVSLRQESRNDFIAVQAAMFMQRKNSDIETKSADELDQVIIEAELGGRECELEAQLKLIDEWPIERSKTKSNAEFNSDDVSRLKRGSQAGREWREPSEKQQEQLEYYPQGQCQNRTFEQQMA